MGSISSPDFGRPLPAAHPSNDTITLLRLRRSTAADLMTAPGPNADQLNTILEIAARAPDHRRVCPYRFVVFEGEARGRAGDVLAEAFVTNEPEASADRVESERRRFMRAPVVVAVISVVDTGHRTPKWEQILTAGAVCQNMLIAANAHGFAAQWITEWYAYNPQVLDCFGVSRGEKIAGFIYIGTAKQPPLERRRPVLSNIVSYYGDSR